MNIRCFVAFAIILGFFALPVPEAKAALVAYWPMEEGSGNTTLNTISANNDSLVGGVPWLTTGLPPVPTGSTAALNFQGGGNILNSTFVGIGGNNPRTVAFWVLHPAITPTDGGFVAWGDSSTTGAKWHIRPNTTLANGTVGALRTEIQGSYLIGTKPLNDGQWHHVVTVFDPSFGMNFTEQVKIYVDGVLDSISGIGATIAVNTTITSGNTGWSPVKIGGRLQVTTTSTSAAALDDVRIYDTALSQAQVTALAAIPEPSSFVLIGLGIVGAIGYARRRRG